MSYITLENLNIINAELTDYCNAACPMCARFTWDGKLNKKKVNQHHTTLNLIREKIPVSVIRQLKKFYSLGTFGDALMNPQTVDIYRYIRQENSNCRLSMHTNGSGRSASFWKDLANLDVRIQFNIDGLEDTNHLYRRNTNWSTIMKNIKYYVEAGGKGSWNFIIFKHNQHQIAEAGRLAQDIGLSFGTMYSDRWKEYNWVTGEERNIDKIEVGDYNIEKPSLQAEKYYHDNSVKVSSKEFDTVTPIECWACSKGNFEIYLRANGNVQPCCMLGELEIHESRRLIDDMKNINLNHSSLEQVLNSDYFKKLSSGIDGTVPENRLKNCFYACGVAN